MSRKPCVHRSREEKPRVEYNTRRPHSALGYSPPALAVHIRHLRRSTSALQKCLFVDSLPFMTLLCRSH
jgi:hypothetical protein